MIGVRDRTTFIDLTQQSQSGSAGDDRRGIARALLFANGIDERGRRLALVFDQPRGSGRASVVSKYSDRRIEAIYASADLDDGAPNVRMIGPSSIHATSPARVVNTDESSRMMLPDRGTRPPRSATAGAIAMAAHTVPATSPPTRINRFSILRKQV